MKRGSFLLLPSEALPVTTVGDVPDELSDIFGDALSRETSGAGVVADGWRSDSGEVYLDMEETDKVARHLAELGCRVYLALDNVRVEFPEGRSYDAEPHQLPNGDRGYAIGGTFMGWQEVASAA